MRKKVTLDKPEIETQAELRETVALVAKNMLTERELKNAMDAKLQDVRAKYEMDLETLSLMIEARTELCAEYCTQHLDLFPRDVKSLDLGQAKVGFRTGTPKVKVLKRWTLLAVLAAVKGRKWYQFIRSTEELDREQIIAARADYSNDALKSVGLKVDQEETFYIEPKLEEQPAGVKVGNLES